MDYGIVYTVNDEQDECIVDGCATIEQALQVFRAEHTSDCQITLVRRLDDTDARGELRGMPTYQASDYDF